MNLKEITNEIQPMDIVVTTQATFSGWWIRKETQSEWSHVCLVGPNQTIYTTGFRFSKVDAFKYLKKQDNFAIFRMPELTNPQKMMGSFECEKLLGQYYPILDIIKMKIQNWIKPGSKILWMDEKNFICSQSVAFIYEKKLGVKLAPQRRLHYSMYKPETCIDDQRLEIIHYVGDS